MAASTAAGSSGKVEVWRDPWGTPHVFAASEEAGFFGLGYACAEDRMLQMDLIRRRAAGRLAEVFGKESLDSDRAARVAGHTQYALAAVTRLPREMQVWLAAYAAGVNAWISSHPDVVVRRFKPLGTKPEPWTPADCLLAARGILSLGSPFQPGSVDAYHRFRESADKIGEADAIKRQFRMAVDDKAAIVPEGEMAKDRDVYRRLKAMPRMPGFDLLVAPGEGPKMSHTWAVGGRRSRTGRPILESDPQLPLSTPPFFYEFHVAAGRIDARGLGLPGFPGLFIGFNRRVAWGGSALGADATVVFLDRLSADGKNYIFQGKQGPFERRLEQIRGKGAPSVVQEVLTNRHGAVFNSLVPKPRAGDAYVLYDAQTQENGSNIRAMLALMSAGNWKEFRAAWEHYYDPGLHVVYADVDGNLGYHAMVHRPLTARSPRMAQEGWTGLQEIRGRIPFGDMPHMLNPEQGFISHANNMPVGSWYPYDLGLGTGGNGHTSRSLRLLQLLSGERKFSVAEFESVVHRDDLNAITAALLPVARKVAEEDKIADPAVLRALESLKGWDMHAGTVHQWPAGRSKTRSPRIAAPGCRRSMGPAGAASPTSRASWGRHLPGTAARPGCRPRASISSTGCASPARAGAAARLPTSGRRA
jgi:penicillin G amidase